MRIAMLVMFLLLASVLLWAGTLTDDFSDGDFEGWRETWMNQNQTTWKVESGVLIGENPSNWSAFLVIGDMTWRDYEVECDARIASFKNSLPTFGIGMYHTGLATAEFKTLWFGLNLKSNQFLPVGAGIVYLSEVQQLAKKAKNMAVELGKWYHFQVSVKGDYFQFYVDGSKVIDIHDKTLISGGVGLEAHAGVAQYDNVIIKGDAVPDLNLSVFPQGKLATRWAELKRQPSRRMGSR